MHVNRYGYNVSVLTAFPSSSTFPSRSTNTPQVDMTCEVLVDICILVDSSESIRLANPPDMSFDNWQLVLNFINNIVDEFPIGDHGARIGVVSFSNTAQLEFPLNRYNTNDQIKEAVHNIPHYNTWTNTADALTVARTECFQTPNGDRPRAKNIAIVITDGIPTLKPHLVDPEATALKRSATMLTVGITDEVNVETLRTLSSPPQLEGVNFFTSPDFQSLDKVLKDLVPQMCVTQPPPNIWTDVTGTNTVTPSRIDMTCEVLVDICILVDSSESIREANPPDMSFDNWQLVLNFINNIVDEFPIGDHGARIGVVSFSFTAQLEFPLNRYNTKDQIKEAVRRIPYLNNWTNTADALTVARTECFRTPSGDRPQAKNVAIVITDGIPNIKPHLVGPEADALRRSSVTMLAVGITNGVNEETLRTLSSPPQLRGQNFFTSPDFQSLDGVLQDLVPQTCVTQPPPGICTDVMTFTSGITLVHSRMLLVSFNTKDILTLVNIKWHHLKSKTRTRFVL